MDCPPVEPAGGAPVPWSSVRCAAQGRAPSGPYEVGARSAYGGGLTPCTLQRSCSAKTVLQGRTRARSSAQSSSPSTSYGAAASASVAVLDHPALGPAPLGEAEWFASSGANPARGAIDRRIPRLCRPTPRRAQHVRRHLTGRRVGDQRLDARQSVGHERARRVRLPGTRAGRTGRATRPGAARSATPHRRAPRPTACPRPGAPAAAAAARARSAARRISAEATHRVAQHPPACCVDGCEAGVDQRLRAQRRPRTRESQPAPARG